MIALRITKQGLEAIAVEDAALTKDASTQAQRSPTGTTIAAMMKTTGWQQHSVRGFLAGVVRKRLKLKLSSKKVDGNRVYRIAGGSSCKTGARPSRQSP